MTGSLGDREIHRMTCIYRQGGTICTCGRGKPMITPQTSKKLVKQVTVLEKLAWQKSDTLAKAIEFLHKTDLSESTRRKIIRDLLKDNFISFYNELVNTKEVEEVIKQ